MDSIDEYRSAMFVPGANEKMLEKAASLKADLILFDLEDSVHLTKKDHARTLVAAKLGELKSEQQQSGQHQSGQQRLGVRINDLSSGHTLADLEAVVPAKPDVIVLPKVETGDDLLQFDTMLSALETDNALPLASIKLIILTAETPKSLFEFNSLINVSDRMIGMTWGAEDLASELGAKQGRDSSGNWLPPFQLAQTFCLAKARDLGVQPLDTVFAGINNTSGLRDECIAAKKIGFTGKLAIHPVQLEVINEVFSPSQQEVDHAERLVKLFSDNPGSGALQLDGKMVDIPHLRSAERLLKRHRA